MDADEILVLDQGRIVERGTHAELLAARRPLRQPLRPAERRRAGRDQRARGRAMSLAGAGVGPGLSEGPARPPRAVVGSQVDNEEQIFGAFDGRILRRFWSFVSPYRQRLILAVIAVLVFAGTQIAIPLVIRSVIDDALVAGGQNQHLLLLGALAFFAIVSLNFVANLVQETLVGRIAEHLLFDLRRAMYAHLQQVSLSFMDKTEVGRLMSRLQGDVNAMQEFLETSVFAIGDLVLLFGITVALLWLDWQLGLLTLSVMPVLLVVRIVWLPRREAGLPAAPGSPARPSTARSPRASTACARCRAWAARRSISGCSRRRRRQSATPSCGAPGSPRSWSRSSTR